MDILRHLGRPALFPGQVDWPAHQLGFRHLHSTRSALARHQEISCPVYTPLQKKQGHVCKGDAECQRAVDEKKTKRSTVIIFTTTIPVYYAYPTGRSCRGYALNIISAAPYTLLVLQFIAGVCRLLKVSMPLYVFIVYSLYRWGDDIVPALVISVPLIK